MTELTRCQWARHSELEIQYHDTEWGVPKHDDNELFQALCLEGAQAGLSWVTILKKRHHYLELFAGFDAEQLLRFTDKQKAQLKNDQRIVRNKLKINSVFSNAKAFLDIQSEFGSFDSYIWSFVDHKPIQNIRLSHSDVPAQTDTSKELSKALKRRGFTFVGPTICYAFMQAAGLVNDHTTDCFRHEQVKAE